MNQDRLVTALFDNRTDAERAVDRLAQIGVPRGDVQIIENSAGASASSSVSSSTNYEEMGFWESLKSLFMPEEDRRVYAEGIRRGGYMVSLRPSEAMHDRVVSILEEEGTVDLNEREQNWRSEGWSGYGRSDEFTGADAMTSGSLGGVTGGTAAGLGAAETLGSSNASSVSGSAMSSQSASLDASRRAGMAETDRSFSSAERSDLGAGRDEVIPVVEEQLRVGKRETDQGRVRVRSYVVEKPVQEQVELRDERVTLERRPVDRPLGDTTDAFRDRTIEATETRQEPVVNKEARVTEEIAVRKDAETRRENVSDTVRSTKVEVDDQRASRNAGTGTGGPSKRP